MDILCLICYLYYIFTEPSLTLSNLASTLKQVHRPEHVAAWLAITDLEIHFITKASDSYDKSLCARSYWEYFLKHHPAPCWKVVAIALWRTGNFDALEQVIKLYLKCKFNSTIS